MHMELRWYQNKYIKKTLQYRYVDNGLPKDEWEDVAFVSDMYYEVDEEELYYNQGDNS